MAAPLCKVRCRCNLGASDEEAFELRPISDRRGRPASRGVRSFRAGFVRVSPRARRIMLRIDAAERRVELVLPLGVPASQGLKFLAAKRGWIAARMDALPELIPFSEGAIVPLLGVPHRIRREVDPAAPPVAVADGEIRVRGDPAHAARRVRDHLVAIARRELTDRAPAARSANRPRGGASRCARHEEPVGKLLGTGRPLVQLAIDPHAGAGIGLRRRPRGRASRRDKSQPALLALGREPLAQ